MNVDEIKDVVRRRYGAFAAEGGSQSTCCSAATQVASGFATDLGLYSAEELATVPEGALNLSRGCGNPTGFADLQAGDVVVDLGCGGGIDVILVARTVGPKGKAIGVDFSQEMIERARQNVADANLDDRDIELHVADLAHTDLPAGCADVLISNCVINLCPDKEAVYGEAFRVLTPGGRLAISDVVLTRELPSELETQFKEMWSCLGGAISERHYFDILTAAGFEDVMSVGAHLFTAEELEGIACCPGPEFAPRVAAELLVSVQDMVRSIKFTARKPGP